MHFYKKLSSIGFLRKSYAFKFLFVAFIGIHLPLIGLIFFVLYGNIGFSSTTILIFTLVMTLIATATTLYVLKKLIKPIELASKALNDYKKDRKIIELPTNFTDEAGLLLGYINNSIQENEKFITDKQDLIYLLSHDLKTYAGNPQALATMILELHPTEEIKELAELIYQSTSQQFQYIENFIKLLKEQDELITTNDKPKLISFQSIVSDVKDQKAQLLESKKIELLIDIRLEKAKLRIDSELLTRVISNLIDNAIKFSFPESEIQLKIYSEHSKTYIKVTDNGIGFDPENSSELFNKFTKMSKLGTSNEASTGIGLYLCRQIIVKNGGVLTAESEGHNKGATFTIVF